MTRVPQRAKRALCRGKRPRERLRVGLATAAVLAVLALVPGRALARRGGGGSSGGSSGGGPFALGLILGEPTGLSGKLFLGSGKHALDFGLGFGSGYYDDNGFRFHMDYLWHPAVLAKNPTFVMPFYVGVGGVFGTFHHNNYQDHNLFGPRVPIGLDMYFRGAPVDIFFELAFVMNLANRADYCNRAGYYCDNRAWLEGAIGVRYAF